MPAVWPLDGDREEIRARYQYALEVVTEHGTAEDAELRARAEGKSL